MPFQTKEFVHKTIFNRIANEGFGYHGVDMNRHNTDDDYTLVEDYSFRECDSVTSQLFRSLIYAGFSIWDCIYPKARSTEVPVLSPSGKYRVRLFFGGKWRQITVTHTVWCDEGSNASLHFQTIERREIWPILLQKAIETACRLMNLTSSRKHDGPLLIQMLTGRIPSVCESLNAVPSFDYSDFESLPRFRMRSDDDERRILRAKRLKSLLKPRLSGQSRPLDTFMGAPSQSTITNSGRYSIHVLSLHTHPLHF